MRLHYAPTAAMAGNATPRALLRRRVEFPSKEKGVNLVGELVWPSDERSSLVQSSMPATSSTLTTSASEKTLPVSVLAHGLADDRDSFLLPRLAEELALRIGVASLRFDFRGNGESGGAFRFGNAATRDGDPADLEAAVEFLLRGEHEEEPRLRFRVVALLGHSKAGSAVVSYAAARGGGGGRGGSKEEDEKKKKDVDGEEEEKEPETTAADPLFVPLIINVAGRFDHADRAAIASRFGDDIFSRVREEAEDQGAGGVPFTWRVGSRKAKKEWRLTAADLADRLGTDMGALCGQLPAETRILCIHGTEDATVPPSAAVRYREAAVEGAEAKSRSLLFPPRVVMVEGADHNFTRREKADELVEAVVAFVAEGLRE